MALAYIGTAGWSIPKQHAAELPQSGSHLQRYGQIFSCAEINSSFYRSHRASTWERWAASVPENFRFSVKAPGAITHEANLACTSDRLNAFLAEARILSNKLGPILFQLPPKSEFNPVVAESFFNLLRDQHPGDIVLEPRNATWFTAEADDFLQRFHIARAAADPARIPLAHCSGGDRQLLYCRLHGSPRMYYSPYPEPYLQSLAATIVQHPAKEIWCIFDNTASGAALGNALALKSFLRIKPPGESSGLKSK